MSARWAERTVVVTVAVKHSVGDVVVVDAQHEEGVLVRRRRRPAVLPPRVPRVREGRVPGDHERLARRRRPWRSGDTGGGGGLGDRCGRRRLWWRRRPRGHRRRRGCGCGWAPAPWSAPAAAARAGFGGAAAAAAGRGRGLRDRLRRRPLRRWRVRKHGVDDRLRVLEVPRELRRVWAATEELRRELRRAVELLADAAERLLAQRDARAQRGELIALCRALARRALLRLARRLPRRRLRLRLCAARRLSRFERSARSPATSVCAARSRSRAASSCGCSRCSRSRCAASSRACESACSASSALRSRPASCRRASPPSPSSWFRIQSILPRMRVSVHRLLGRVGWHVFGLLHWLS